MADQGSLNGLLQWSLNNSTNAQNPSTTNGATNGNSTADPSRGLNAAALAELLGGPSDADRMRSAMTAILSLEVSQPDKEIAWDNFEQLIENLDNANNMSTLGLWQPLLSQLSDPEAENRRMAAWCLSTAVQNNVKSQEALLAQGGVKLLVGLVEQDGSLGVRKKAVSALSSEVRNFQQGFDELMVCLSKELGGQRRGIDAGDMEAVDEVIGRLRGYTQGAS